MLAAISILWIARSVAIAQSPPASPGPDAGLPINESLSALAKRIILENLPRQFEEKKDWGKTTKIVNGLRLKDDGDGLKIRKHTKEVKDGLWKQYRGALIDPEQQLQIRVENIRQIDSSHSAFQVFIAAKLHGEARLEQWKDGIKLFNVVAEAESKVESRIDCEIAWDWKPGGLLGQISVEPKVTGVRIDLVEFELKKLSKIEGWAARELGENFKGTIARKLHSEEPKLADKLNRAIAKRQDRLHFSPDAIVAGGFSKLGSLFKTGEER